MNGAATRKALEGQALARGRAMKQAVYETVPEAVGFLQDLIAAGFEIGWRNVAYVGPARVAGVPASQRFGD